MKQQVPGLDPVPPFYLLHRERGEAIREWGKDEKGGDHTDTEENHQEGVEHTQHRG